ncbi:DeoR/GlpR family DNA-binding transcription regulator [Microbacterium sp. ZW T5_56]|uniref:DeoR/GlpR family DNA-binding transcription regulator n=1 Tax=Microbacterium sp. ZW T5_56 TaxID=3378081 RepID=UPI0038531473
MLVEERRAQLIDAVRRRGAATVAELIAELDVSAMTVRRDIDALAAEGRLRKVRGGATIEHGATVSTTIEARRARMIEEKRAIAREARRLVEPGMVIGLSGSTTTWVLAQELRAIADLTIVTNSLPVADLFARPQRADEPYLQTVVLTGGVRTPADSFVGPVAVRALEHLHCDIVFLSATGVDAHAGLTTANLLEAETDRALAAAGREAVLLADHGKWGVVSLTTVIELGQADRIITDSGMSEGGLDVLRGLIADVRVAEVS